MLYVLEANPRASRTVPFVSKATAVPLAKAAARIMLGATHRRAARRGHAAGHGDGGTLPLDAPIAVKEAVLPFGRFRDAPGSGVDTVLGPEMRSTGEVMGIDAVFGTAYAQVAGGGVRVAADQGRAFVSVANRDKRSMIFPVKRLADLGFEIWPPRAPRRCCAATGSVPRSCASTATAAGPDGEPTIVDAIHAGEVDLIVNTPFGSPASARARRLRDPHGRGPPRHPVRDHGRRAGRRRPGHRGASSGARWASGRSRSTGRRGTRMQPVARPCGTLTAPVQIRGTVLTVAAG